MDGRVALVDNHVQTRPGVPALVFTHFGLQPKAQVRCTWRVDRSFRVVLSVEARNLVGRGICLPIRKPRFPTD